MRSVAGIEGCGCWRVQVRSNNHRGERPKLHPSTPSNQISTLIGTCTSFTCLHFYVRGYLLGVLARSEVLARLPAQVLAQSARSGCLLYPSDYLEMARILTTRRLYGRRRRKLPVEPPASPAGPAAVDPTAAVAHARAPARGEQASVLSLYSQASNNSPAPSSSDA